MGSGDLQNWMHIGTMNRFRADLLIINNLRKRFMESTEHRRQCLIVPMNLRDSDSVAVACSVAARDSGAIVPVGKIGSDTRQYNCLVTPFEVFPLGRFAFFVMCVGRVGGGPKFDSCFAHCTSGEGAALFKPVSQQTSFCKKPCFFNLSRGRWFMGSPLFLSDLLTAPLNRASEDEDEPFCPGFMERASSLHSQLPLRVRRKGIAP